MSSISSNTQLTLKDAALAGDLDTVIQLTSEGTQVARFIIEQALTATAMVDHLEASHFQIVQVLSNSVGSQTISRTLNLMMGKKELNSDRVKLVETLLSNKTEPLSEIQKKDLINTALRVKSIPALRLILKQNISPDTISERLVEAAKERELPIICEFVTAGISVRREALNEAKASAFGCERIISELEKLNCVD